MGKLLANAHWFLLIYIGFQVYDQYTAHQQRLLELQTQIPNLDTKIKQAKKEEKQVQDYFRDIEAAKQKIDKVAAQIERLQQQLPNTIDDTANLQVLSAIASELNIRDVYIMPKEEVAKDFYFIKEYSFKGRGTFLQFLIFFEKVEKISMNNRLLNVGGINLKRDEMKQKGRFQLITAEFTIQGYRNNPNYKEERGPAPVEEKKSDPKKAIEGLLKKVI